jgi:hypothetical protein
VAPVRGADVRIEYQPVAAGAWTDVTCEVTSADWQWGATTPLGPLTVSEGGTLRLSLYDPDRTYDPGNPASPLIGVLRPGMPIRVRVETGTAWTGGLQSWEWDYLSDIATLEALDPIGQLSQMVLPGEPVIVNASSYQQTVQVLDVVGWPAGARYLPTPSGVNIGSKYPVGSALDELQKIRLNEHGAL